MLSCRVSEPEVSGPVVAQYNVMGAWSGGMLSSSRSQGSKKVLGSQDPLYRQVPQCHVVFSQADDLTHGSLWGQSHHSNSNLTVDTGRLPCKIQYSSIEPFK